MGYIFFLIPLLILGILAFLNSLFITNIFNLEKKYKRIIFGIFYFLFIIFFGSLIAGRFFEINFIKYPYKIGAFALGGAFLSFLVLFPFYILKKIYKKDFPIFLKIFVGICLISINIFGLYNAYSYKIIKYSIKTEKETILKGKKLILIADTHYGNIFSENDAKNLVKKLNSIEADGILIAGDFFDGPSIDYKKIGNIFKKLNKPAFFAPGNHEEYGDFYSMITALNSKEIIVLNNEKIKFFDANIAGVTYSENREKEIFETILKNIASEKEKFNILIKHEPRNQEIAFENNYDLIVSGHTHKGQMWPFSIITEKIYGKYFYGLIEENGKYSITTSGVGSWGPPQRFGSRSEIIIIEIK